MAAVKNRRHNYHMSQLHQCMLTGSTHRPRDPRTTRSAAAALRRQRQSVSLQLLTNTPRCSAPSITFITNHADWYGTLRADDMHKPWLFSLSKGLDYTPVCGCDWRAGKVLLKLLNRDIFPFFFFSKLKQLEVVFPVRASSFARETCVAPSPLPDSFQSSALLCSESTLSLSLSGLGSYIWLELSCQI